MSLYASGVRLGFVLGLASLVASCGGDGGTQPATLSLTAVGSTSLVGFTDTQVGPLQVRITSNGQPSSGVTVSWAVSGGNGALSAMTTTTDAAGNASVTWTLGPAAGTHTVTASSAGAGSVTFNASVTFGTLEPSVDIPLSGSIDVDRVIIPAGITVTVTGPTTINVAEEVEIAGTLSGDCHLLEIVGSGGGIVSGVISNTCGSGAEQVGPDLEFTVDGELTVSGTVESSGELLIRNTPDLTPADADAFFASSPQAAPSMQVPNAMPCTLDGANIAAPGKPPTVLGQDGQDGKSIYVLCSGDIEATGGGEAGGAGSGGDAGAGEPDDSEPGEAMGSGGNAGDGGDWDLFTPMGIRFNGYTIRLPRGGDGGDATVIAGAPGQSASATGGNGGNGGGMNIGAGGGIVITSAGLTIISGGGGKGGDATAIGAKGRDGNGEPAQNGGSATATSGDGGHTSAGRLRASGAVTGTINITLTDAGPYGDGGDGGKATAISGQGGNGGLMNPDGADGGAILATAGKGGDVRTQSISGAFVGDGGDGGDIEVGGGGGGGAVASRGLPPLRAPSMGGGGFDRCDPPVGQGGAGGVGGGAAGSPGGKGDSGNVTSDGDDGKIEVLDDTGVGGPGGDGLPPGGGGEGGSDGLAAGFDRTNGSPIFEEGPDGAPCPAPNTKPTLDPGSSSTFVDTPVMVTLDYTDAENDDPDLGTVTVNNLDPAEGAVSDFEVVRGPESEPVGLKFTFTPAPGFVGSVNFQIGVTDARGALSNNPATVMVEVTSDTVANLDLSGVDTTPGVTSTQPLRDGVGVQVGAMQMMPSGMPGSFFFGTNPTRIGTAGGPTNFWIFDLASLVITGDPSAYVKSIILCFLNTSGVSSENPIIIDFPESLAAPPPSAPPAGQARVGGETVGAPGDGCGQVNAHAYDTGNGEDNHYMRVMAPSGSVIDLEGPVFLIGSAQAG